MTGIVCSLYPEAEWLIQKLDLKQKQLLKGFSCFSDEAGTIILVLSGTGKIHAAAAVSSLLQKYSCSNLLLFSSCAGLKQQEAGTAYLVNKLTDLETGMSFYPDLLWNSSLPEASLLCGDLALGIKRKGRDTKAPYDATEVLKDCSYKRYALYDMDSSGAAFTAEKFLGPHQIHIIKVVTDNGTKINPNAFMESMHAGSEKASTYIDAILSMAGEQEKADPSFEKTAEEMCCSETMKAQLKQLYAYASAAGMDIHAALEEMHRDGMLPCSTREAGKKALHALSRKLTA